LNRSAHRMMDFIQWFTPCSFLMVSAGIMFDCENWEGWA
jgi:hypothetical protein